MTKLDKIIAELEEMKKKRDRAIDALLRLSGRKRIGRPLGSNNKTK